jgi:hypothetical protein
METLKETLLKQQDEAEEKLIRLADNLVEAEKEYKAAKAAWKQQNEICEQNARALKAFEPRKPRAKKTPKDQLESQRKNPEKS